jgi:hypothetical protein
LVTPRAYQQNKVQFHPVIVSLNLFLLPSVLQYYFQMLYPDSFLNLQHQKYEAPSEPDPATRRSQGNSVAPNRSSHPSSSSSVSLKSLANSTSPKTRSGGFEMPILFVDVKLKDGSFDRISVHRGDDIGQLSLVFARKHSLDEAAKAKLELLLRRKVAENALE